MEAQEAQTQKLKIPATIKEEEIFRYDPHINSQVIKQFSYIDSPDRPDSFTYSSSDSEREIMEAHIKRELYLAAGREDKIFLDPNYKYASSEFSVIETGSETESDAKVKTETMQTCLCMLICTLKTFLLELGLY